LQNICRITRIIIKFVATRVLYLPNLRMTLDHTAYKSYRPINLTPFMLKSLERLVKKYNNL